MEYKQLNGTKLYGFSQISLDRNTMWIKILTLVLLLLVMLVAFAIYRVDSGNMLANSIDRIAEAIIESGVC